MNEHQVDRRTDERKGDGQDTERALESDIERLRGELDGMVSELDRRRHEALDLRLQLRRHSGVVAALGVVAVLVSVVGVMAWSASRRRQDRLVDRVQNLARAIAIMSRNPDRLERALEGKRPAGSAVTSAIAKLAGAAGQRAILGA
jgi:hypothetical protein